MSYLGSYLRYRSALNGRPCVAVLSRRRSENRKTGDMVQVSFMATGKEPHRAARSGADVAVCGDCPQRPANGGCCYVVTCQGPLSQYRAWKRGRYQKGARQTARPVRYGSYGDPGSMAPETFRELHADLSPDGWTGYTHQWRRRPDLAPFLMASVDSEQEAREAKRAGWRYFRIKHPEDRYLPGEVQCPAEKTGGKVKCRQCLLCCGGARKGPHVAITVHGARKGRFA